MVPNVTYSYVSGCSKLFIEKKGIKVLLNSIHPNVKINELHTKKLSKTIEYYNS